jgi:hypothetical protein
MVLRPAQGSTPKRAHHVPKSGAYGVRINGSMVYFQDRPTSRRVRAVVTLAIKRGDPKSATEWEALTFAAKHGEGRTARQIFVSTCGGF